MRQFLKAINKASDLGSIGASVCILIIIALILVEIFMRTVSGRSTFVTEEFSGYLLSWFAYLGMAYTFKTDGHIRVTMVLSKIGDRKRVTLEILAGVIGMATFAYLTIHLAMVMHDSLTSGVRSMHISETPLFIPQIIPVVGSALMTFQFLPYLVDRWHDFVAAKKKKGEVING